MQPRILVLTAKGQQQNRKSALEYGADLFISQSCSNAEVMAVIAPIVADD